MTLALAAIPFLAALGAALAWRRTALRWIALVIFGLAPLRGALEKLLLEAGSANPRLLANALEPALVAALALGVILVLRPRLRELPRILVVGWSVIAIACALDLLTEAVGLKQYGIGLAQYLVYPTYALALWPLFEPGDLERLGWAFLGIASFVALTVVAQRAGFHGFVQEAPSNVGLAANRYAGATGSALHSSAYLGSAAAVAVAVLAMARTRKALFLSFAALAVILTGQTLTYTRSGLIIAALGAGVLLFVLPGAARKRLAALLAAGLCIALVIGAIGGVTPSETFSRLAHGVSTSSSGDPSNAKRLEFARQGIKAWADFPLSQQLTGYGLATTGNASKLIGSPLLIVESYFVKILVETGLIGLLLIGGYLIWALVELVRSAMSRAGPLLTGFAAAAIGLLLYAIFYPVLETQVLSCTWWLLFAACVRFTGPEPAPRPTPASARPPYRPTRQDAPAAARTPP